MESEGIKESQPITADELRKARELRQANREAMTPVETEAQLAEMRSLCTYYTRESEMNLQRARALFADRVFSR